MTTAQPVAHRASHHPERKMHMHTDQLLSLYERGKGDEKFFTSPGYAIGIAPYYCAAILDSRW